VAPELGLPASIPEQDSGARTMGDATSHQSSDTAMIEVTPSAVNRIRRMLAENHIEGGLRLGVVGGGCSGLSYKFKFEQASRPTDNVFEVDGVKLMVDPKSYEYLKGLILDFKDTLIEQAFVFHNPNAAKSCGCGKSFITE
jgi:iron-sulfur cluster assembly protein